MENRNLWRLRLTLFIIIAALYVLVPSYEYFGYPGFDGATFLEWRWGSLCIENCGHVYISPVPWWWVVLGMIVGIIIPFILGVTGCLQTRRQARLGLPVRPATRMLTQVGVTALLFSASGGVLSVITYLIGFYTEFTPTLYLPLYACCAIPLVVVLAVFSYDLPHMRARDFMVGHAPTRTRDEILRDTSPYPSMLQDLGKKFARQGDLGAAVGAFERGVVVAPEDPKTWHNLAVTFEKVWNFGAALFCWDKAAQLGDDAGKQRGIELRGNKIKPVQPRELALDAKGNPILPGPPV